MWEKLNSSIWALALATQLVSAEPNEELANSLKDQKSELSIQTSWKVKQVKDDVNKTVANNYLTNIKAYGVWEKSQDNIYNWVWLAVEWSNWKLVIEKWQDFTKVWWVWKYDLQSWVYMKWWAAYLSKKLDVSWDKYNVWQSTLWAWVWIWNDSYNLEAGHLVSWINVSGIDWVNTTAHRTYLEWAMRNKWSLWQLDLTWELKKTTLYWEQTNSYKATAEYYPTNDVQVWVSQTSESIKNGDFRITAWVKYTFDNWKWSPYLEAWKNMWEHTSAKLVYENWIAQKPLSMKNTFEDAALSSNLVDEGKIAEKIQKKKDELAQANSNEVVNNAPTLNLSMSGSFFRPQWTDDYRSETWWTITFDMSASTDSDWTISNYKIENLTDWGTIYSWTSNTYTITNAFNWQRWWWKQIKITVTDDKWATSSKTITIMLDM